MLTSQSRRLEAERGAPIPLRLVESEGVRTVRNACLTINSSSPDVIRSMTIVVSLDDIPVGPSNAVGLAERIVTEYGLVADARLSWYNLVVRIHRELARNAGGEAKRLGPKVLKD